MANSDYGTENTNDRLASMALKYINLGENLAKSY